MELLEPLVQKALTSSSASKRCAVDLGASVNSVKGTDSYTYRVVLSSKENLMRKTFTVKNLFIRVHSEYLTDAAAPRKYTEHDRYT